MEIKKRFDWLDVAKAIGVYLVILGHLVIFNFHTFRFIFAFHMPFFFVAAGYVWKDKDGFGTFIKKSCKHYLVPYMAISILGIMQCFLLPMPGHNMQTLQSSTTWTWFLYGGYPAHSYFSSAWFLIALFWAQLMLYGLVRIGKRCKKYISVLVWICVVLIAVFSKDIFGGIPPLWRLPWKIDSAFMATVFMGIGVLVKKIGILEKGKWYWWLLCVSVCTFATWLFGSKWNYYVNICDVDYGKAHCYLLAAICGSFMMFGLGKLLYRSKVLQFIGKNTLFIFLSHQAVCEIVIHFAGMITDEYIKWQDMRLNCWSIGISIVTLAICTLLAWGYGKLKELLVNLKYTKGGTAHEKNQRTDTLL